MSTEFFEESFGKALPSARAHPEDRDVASDESRAASDDEEQGQQDSLDEVMLPHHSSSLPAITGVSHNTGVKGVIADAKSYANHRRSLKQTRQAPINKYADDVQDAQEHTALVEIDSSDEEVMAEWRKNRLAELKASGTINRRSTPSKRTYGSLEDVDADGYLDAIEKVGTDTVVVVVVYDKMSSESALVEQCFASIAPRSLQTRFVKLHYDIAEMDPEVVPAVLAYKGGDLFANIPRIVDEIPPGSTISVGTLEKTLQREGVLQGE